jgi:citrate lyase subunit beta/citryl-CoA lyase
VVRINGTDTQWFRRDLEAVVHSGIHAVCLPNVEDVAVADVDVVVKALRKARASAELAIWVMAETPKEYSIYVK